MVNPENPRTRLEWEEKIPAGGEGAGPGEQNMPLPNAMAGLDGYTNRRTAARPRHGP